MSDFLNTNQESKRRWEINAGFWDEKMGDDSNQFHREVVRPLTETLLSPKAGELILDAACGTGNFSQRLAELGADVVAFDFSEIMIANAKRRRAAYEKKISFFVCDATKKEELLGLRQTRLFDKAVSNMGMMDISELRPLLQAVYELLKPGGSFVFSTHHPCFERPADKYMTSCVHEGEAIQGQPVPHFYYHRPLQRLFAWCFEAGFVLDGFYENSDRENEIPVIIIVRLRKPKDM